jgi:hypothetical protein
MVWCEFIGGWVCFVVAARSWLLLDAVVCGGESMVVAESRWFWRRVDDCGKEKQQGGWL